MISVVMATYNGARYIEEQLNSILDQTFTDFELLVVDDCSTDDTVSILRKYSCIDLRISIYENEINLGCSKTFEKGVGLAHGDFIALVDQDDVWHPKKLEILVYELKNSNLDMVYSNCNLIDRDGNIVDYPWTSITPLFGSDSQYPNVETFAAFNSFILGCAMLFKAESLKMCLPFVHSSANHDKWIVNNIAFWGKFKFINIELFSYRIHENNLSMKRTNAPIYERLVSAFKLSLPFYSPDDIERIIKLGEEKGRDVLVYRQLSDSIRSFHKRGLRGRLELIETYYTYLYVRLKGLQRAREIIKLTLTQV